MIQRKVVGRDPWAPREPELGEPKDQVPEPPYPEPQAAELGPITDDPFADTEEEAAAEDAESGPVIDKEPEATVDGVELGPVIDEEHEDTAAGSELGPITDAEFEEMVEQAIEAIPAELAAGVENCAFIVERESPRGKPELLGLYRGRPLTERGDYSGALPDTITIYQGPLMRHFPGREALAKQVYRTVVHEVGHYFGFEEHELHDLGWG